MLHVRFADACGPAMRSIAALAIAILSSASAVADIGAQLASGSSDLQRLSLPDDLPASFAIELQMHGRQRTLWLAKHSVRAEHAGLRVWHHSSGLRPIPLPESTIYRGQVLDDPTSIVVASLLNGQCSAWVLSERDGPWSLVPAGEYHHVETGIFTDYDDWPCGAELDPTTTGFKSKSTTAAASSIGPISDVAGAAGHIGGIVPGTIDCVFQGEIAFDADFEYYQHKGSSVAATVAAVESRLAVVNAFYERDLSVTQVLTLLIVRTSPFYTPTGGGHLLGLFRAEWMTTQAAVPRDLAHLMTGKDGSLIEYGGLAYVAVVCNFTYGYGWSMDSAGILGHELGHNWGAGHCHDLEPCNNMCGACLYIAPITRGIMMAHRDSRSCLDRVPSTGAPLPPYASEDNATMLKDELAAGTPISIDVLANDTDGNCQPLEVAAVDAMSAQGATLSILPSAGPLGRDLVRYSPGSQVFVGEDEFSYTASDGHGGLDTAIVRIQVYPVSLTALWRLDETDGSLVADASHAGLNGVTLGNPVWISGHVGGALNIDSIDDSVLLPTLNLNTSTITLTTWLRRSGVQNDWGGIIFCRGGTTVAGLHFGQSNELRYTWNADPASRQWDSGIVPPYAEWVFIALVVRADSATIHMYDGTGWQSATNTMHHQVEAFDAELRLGWDDGANNRRMHGRLDDVHIYRQPLDQAQLQDVMLGGERAFAPFPSDGGTLAHPEGQLLWLAGLTAQTHEIYIGWDYLGVRDADHGSLEYRGSLAEPQYTIGGFGVANRYFWRVDEVGLLGKTVGEVWQFELADAGHWRLDELFGTTALDSLGNHDGSYQLGPVLGELGATPQLGFSVRFDGGNDRVRMNALDLNTDSLTITAWVRRDGAQAEYSGLVFSRAANTAAGLSVGTHDELRYTWNDEAGTFGWDSGLVLPNDTWVFVALVVEPARATLYMSQGGGLTSAEHVYVHGVEQFDGPLDIARDAASVQRSFKGWMDDVRVFNGALTPEQVEGLYLGSF